MTRFTLKSIVALFALALVGCSSTPTYDRETAGGRYKVRKDFAPDNPPDVSNVADAVPVDIPYSRGGNRSTYEVWGKSYNVLPSHIGYRAEGIASWYGLKFHGHKTSNGEIYDIYKMSAAHKSLPIPSFAKVTNLDNGKSVIVRVNDRGPFHENRLIDLSYSAAARLEILKQGTGRVRVEAIDARSHADTTETVEKTPQPVASLQQPKPDDTGAFLQVGSFGKESSALSVQRRLSAMDGVQAVIKRVRQGDVEFHRVLVGPLTDTLSIDSMVQSLESMGYSSPLLIKSP
ncbi:RlpA-like protein precursor [Marinobacterium sp. xm-a-121]|uniref:septal ring lytic transglycosylase RlpA family protein n=1 Tax=unclassified Marinobacterium TaxID=2644139 RepID=UPI001A003976|nr:RlpA-like protein precursor [Marinobacterium sp. xm-d-420]NRP39581.1 RlpA-like protein precursor [Marinobacterium sp. xm-a-121]NRP47732.1 RlpA-like protein precursor [Marinobacterium sp. xm-d-543]NRP60554.1 RlpA-like protein precursor [Marinobacterium sp. xm-d-564]NRQ00525.1 RlpA-like protein precursor [Marinobacterium sp. xm-v-233]NRQ23971.1 RlpA-like protein precursor [Marinobacterium sp. xm-m-312]